MALSGFIKQLLETDTVFGSEAKKVTGINDSTVRSSYRDSNIKFTATSTSLDFTINNYDITLPTPLWLSTDKYVKFFFRNYDMTDSAYLGLLIYQDVLFRLLSAPVIDIAAKTLTISFQPNVEGTPPFSQLISTSDLSGVDVIIDGRIFTLIGDPDIAREASNGSTMFNLDNTDSTEYEADSSGIVRKYGAHYHTDISSELTVHDRDSAGYPLIRPAIGTEGITQTILFDEVNARNQALARIVNTDNTQVTFTLGTNSVVVAQYGLVGLNLSGDFIRIGTDAPPRFNASEDGTVADSDGFSFRGISWTANLRAADRTITVRNWPVSRDPSFDPAVVAGIAINDIIFLLNSEFIGEYVFTRLPNSNGQIPIFYQAVATGDIYNVEPIPINNGGTGDRIFHNSANVLPGQNEKPITGNEFKTEAELLLLLRNNTLGFVINDPESRIIISANVPGTREVSFVAPTTTPPVWANENSTAGLLNLPVSDNTYRTIISTPELVFDLQGNAIFNLPGLAVREDRYVIS